MSTLVWGAGSFLAAFLLHMAVWRVRVPERQTKVLLLIMFAVLAAALAFLKAGGGRFAAELGLPAPETAGDFLHLALINISLVLSYMITYSAMEADSPSLVIVMAVAGAGPDGMEEDAPRRYFNDDRMVKPRIRDLLLDKLARKDGGLYRLTAKGRLFAALFMSYRFLLGRGKGG